MKFLLLIPYLCREAGDSCGELETAGFVLHESNAAASSASKLWRCPSGNLRCMVVVCSSLRDEFSVFIKVCRCKMNFYLGYLPSFEPFTASGWSLHSCGVPSRQGIERRNTPGTCALAQSPWQPSPSYGRSHPREADGFSSPGPHSCSSAAAADFISCLGFTPFVSLMGGTKEFSCT